MSEQQRKNFPTLWEKSRQGRKNTDTTLTDFITTDRKDREVKRFKKHEAEHNEFRKNHPEIVDWVNEVLDETFRENLKSELARRIEKSQAYSPRLGDIKVENIIFKKVEENNLAAMFIGEKFIHIDNETLRGWFEKKDINSLKFAFTHEVVHINSFTRIPVETKTFMHLGYSAPNTSNNLGTFINEGATDWMTASILSAIDPTFTKMEWSEIFEKYVTYKPHLQILQAIVEAISRNIDVDVTQVAYAFDRSYFNGEFFRDEISGKKIVEVLGQDLWDEILRLKVKDESREKIVSVYKKIVAVAK